MLSILPVEYIYHLLSYDADGEAEINTDAGFDCVFAVNAFSIEEAENWIERFGKKLKSLGE